jgi:hypothetical protein
MANAVYTKAKESLLKGQINTTASNYKVLLIDSNEYTVNISSDQFVSDIPSNAIKATSGNLSNITSTNGILNADDIVIDHSGEAFDAIALYQVGSSNSDSRLILYIDNSEGLPFEGTNSNISITIFWSDTVSKILSL